MLLILQEESDRVNKAITMEMWSRFFMCMVLTILFWGEKSKNLCAYIITEK